MKNTWIEQEERDMKREISKNKDLNPNYHLVRMVCFLFVICSISYANTTNKECEMRGVWGDTWICPNSSCGYENYDAIGYCALCGTKRK